MSHGEEFRLVLDNALTEVVEAQAIDGKKHQIRIRALGEVELIEALNQSGLEFYDLGNMEKLKSCLMFIHAICNKSIGDFVKVLQWGEPAKLLVRIFAISNIPVTVTPGRPGPTIIQ